MNESQVLTILDQTRGWIFVYFSCRNCLYALNIPMLVYPRTACQSMPTHAVQTVYDRGIELHATDCPRCVADRKLRIEMLFPAHANQFGVVITSAMLQPDGRFGGPLPCHERETDL